MLIVENHKENVRNRREMPAHLRWATAPELCYRHKKTFDDESDCNTHDLCVLQVSVRRRPVSTSDAVKVGRCNIHFFLFCFAYRRRECFFFLLSIAAFERQSTGFGVLNGHFRRWIVVVRSGR